MLFYYITTPPPPTTGTGDIGKDKTEMGLGLSMDGKFMIKGSCYKDNTEKISGIIEKKEYLIIPYHHTSRDYCPTQGPIDIQECFPQQGRQMQQ